MTAPDGYKQIPVKTWYLKFKGVLPEVSGTDSFRLEYWEKPSAADYLDLYKAVGRTWGWTGRLLKTRDELEAILNSSENEVWLFKVENETAGFFELVRSADESELVYLGLKPEWIGQGLGQKLIQAAIAVAGKNGEKVWLHTCERDHESALKSYLKAGFIIEKEIISLEYYPE